MRREQCTAGMHRIIALVLLCLLLPGPATAKKRRRSTLGQTINGAALGAVIGKALGDDKGAKKGAALGALLGALKAEERKKQERGERRAREEAYRQERLRIEQERLDLERQMEARRQALAAQAPAPVVQSPSAKPVRSTDVSFAPEIIKSIQRSLFVLGYISPPIDGNFDQELREAILKFQRDRGRPQEGLPSQALLDDLRVSGG